MARLGAVRHEVPGRAALVLGLPQLGAQIHRPQRQHKEQLRSHCHVW